MLWVYVFSDDLGHCVHSSDFGASLVNINVVAYICNDDV